MRPLLAVFAVACFWACPVDAQEKKGGVKLTDMPVKTTDFVYRTTPQGELKLHVYSPADHKASDKRPAIVFFFGGGWKSGSYTQFVPQSEYFASRGLVCICADYRIASIHKTTPDACIEDAKSAIRTVRKKASELGVDPERIVAAGGSAGGHLAAATALVPGFDPEADSSVSCKPSALLLFNPALNLTRNPIRDAAGKDVAAAISPTKFLAKGTVPTWIVYGTKDPALDQGKEFLSKAKELGVKAELYTAADQPHGFFNRSPWTQVTAAQADRFLVSLGMLSGEPTLKIPDNAPQLTKLD